MLEIDRILDLPRWEYDDAELVKKWTSRFRRPEGTWELRPAQARLLEAIERFGGAVGFLPVGLGKTITCMLAGSAAGLGAEEVLYLVPAKLKKEAEREYPIYAEQFDFPKPRIVSYEKLSRVAEFADACGGVAPKMIVCDEAHMLSNPKSARGRAFVRHMRKHPETIFVPMSGSFAKRRLHDYAWLVELALGDRNPLPRTWPRLEAWGRCIDVDPQGESSRSDWRDLVRLAKWAGLDVDGAPSLRGVARQGFGERLASAEGVVVESKSSCDARLFVRPAPEVECPAIIREKLAELSDTWEIDGEEIPDLLRLTAAATQLSQGFYYKWEWPDGEPDREWLYRRRAWASTCTRISGKRGLETPARVEAKVRSGELGLVGSDLVAWREWQEVSDRPVPPTVAVWLTDEILLRGVELARANEGVLWYEHRAVRERLNGEGWLVAPGRGEVVDRSLPCQALSVRLHGTGLNLQAYSYGAVMCPPRQGLIWEQLVGRMHRSGQAATEVVFETFEHTGRLRSAMRSAREDARYIEATTKIEQKLNLALARN